MNFCKLFLQIIACGYILVQLLKQSFSTQNQGGKISQFKSYKISTSYCRKHRKFAKFIILHNRIQISEKFSPVISKLAFSQSATAIVLQTSINCSHTKLSKQHLTAHTSIVKGYTAKCYKHTPFSSSALLWSLVLESQQTFSAQNTKQINLAYIDNYNKNIS